MLTFSFNLRVFVSTSDRKQGVTTAALFIQFVQDTEDNLTFLGMCFVISWSEIS